MKPYCLAVLLTTYLALCSPAHAAVQVGGGHTLFGDFKVDESQYSGIKPQTFFVLLYRPSGQLIARQPVINNGRYRFLDVLNGEYDIVVEVENQEAVRLRVNLIDRAKTEIRHDLFLEWRSKPGTQGRAESGSISAADYYKRQPENDDRLVRAQQAIKRANYKDAIALLRQIVTADAKDFVAWTELGTAYFKQGDMGDAEKSYQSALNERPSFLLALLNLGKLRMTEKNFEAAIEVLTRAVGVEPKSSDANYFLGESYLQVRKGSKAVGFFNEALRLDPIEKADAHLRLAALYKAAGLNDKAVTEYERFLEKRPDYPERKALEQYISNNKRR